MPTRWVMETMVVVVPMRRPEFDAFLARSIPSYAASHVAAGNWDEAGSLERSKTEHQSLLPQGLETPGHFLWVVRDRPEGAHVGELWYQVSREDGRADFYIFWIGIVERFRRHGYGTEVLQWVEAQARKEGAHRVGLHVFADNSSAQALYTKAGYRSSGLSMVKRIDSPSN